MRNRFYFLLILILPAAGLFPQNDEGKCGTVRHIRERQGERMERISDARPVLDATILTPSGKFRIHYDTAGAFTPVFLDENGLVVPNTTYRTFIDTLSSIIDSVYRAEVLSFGFPPPAEDAGRGGGNEYDIYIVDMGPGWFGETVPEYDFPLTAGKTNEQYPTYMRIDNDFGPGFRTKGIAALKVTCAHEFQHAIQVSGAGLWVSDFYFYEMCAEAFEPMVFPDVKDYIFDVKRYYDGDILHKRPIPLFSADYGGYERAIFGYFMMRKYGTSIMVDVWMNMQMHRPVPALLKAYDSRMTTLETEFSEFSEWNFYTGPFADSSRYFPDAKIFPPLTYHQIGTARSGRQSIHGNSRTFATHFAKIYHGFDSTHFILTTANSDDLTNGNEKEYFYQIDFSATGETGLTEIRPNLFALFKSVPTSDLHHWKYRVQTSQGPYIPVPDGCFPNPYNPQKGLLYITGDIDPGSEVYIFTSSMDLVYSGPVGSSRYSGKAFAAWNGIGNDGRVVSSGIYFYFLKSQGSSTQGKFAVIR